MQLGELVARQIASDRRRGFSVDFTDEQERQTHIERDLVGLLGEIGEFANLLKKVRLGLDHETYTGPSLAKALPALREELADTTIYIMRLFTMLDGDMEAELVSKMTINDSRYGELERD